MSVEVIENRPLVTPLGDLQPDLRSSYKYTSGSVLGSMSSHGKEDALQVPPDQSPLHVSQNIYLIRLHTWAVRKLKNTP